MNELVHGLGRVGAGLVWILAAAVGVVLLIVLSPILLISRIFRGA